MPERIVAVITSRWNSTRLPGKALIDIEGKPLLQRVVDQCRKTSVAETIVATTLNSTPIIEYCQNNGIVYSIYAGDENDILGRLFGLALMSGSTGIIRVWGDCPLVSPSIIQFLKVRSFDKEFDYFYESDQFGGAAFISFDTLYHKNEELKDPKEREWFHRHMLLNPSVRVISQPVLYSVDTPEDLERVREYVRTHPGLG